jgi:tripartite-type tricarboxylate transporter receptor subunit TctC
MAMAPPGRRGLLALSLGAGLPRGAPAQQQDWPDRPLRLLLPVAPGGPADGQARLVGPRLAERLGQPVVVENRPGANGIVAAEILARAAPDANTLMLSPSGTYVINPSLYRSIPYDPFRDFAPVVLLSRVPLVLVAHPSVPAKSLPELLALVRARPGGMPYASAGSGTPSHLAMEMLRGMAGAPPLPLVHVPFNGSGPSLAAVVGGQVPIAIEAVFSASPLVRGGQLKALAAAGAERLVVFPDLPTVAESGLPGFDAATWLAFLAPARTPPERVRRLAAEVNAVLRLPELRGRFLDLGAEPAGGTPEALEAFARAEFEKWGRVVRETGTTAG